MFSFKKDCPFFSTTNVGFNLLLSCSALDALDALSFSTADLISPPSLLGPPETNWRDFIILFGFTLLPHFLMLARQRESFVFYFPEILAWQQLQLLCVLLV